MNGPELRRPSTWLFAVALALAVVGMRLMADIQAGTIAPAQLYFGLLLATFGWALLAAAIIFTLLACLAWLPDVVASWRALKPSKPAPIAPRPAVTYSRLVSGTVMGKPSSFELPEMKTARWAAWNDTALEVVAWYRHTGSLIYGAMAGRDKAFIENKDAQAVYTEMARVGLVNLVNGKTTTWADSLPSILRVLRSGRLEWTEAADPPAIRPAPRPFVRRAERDEDD